LRYIGLNETIPAFLDLIIHDDLRKAQQIEAKGGKLRRLPEDRADLAAKVIQHRLKAIMVCNLRGEIEIVNKAFTRITGYLEDEVRGKAPEFFYSEGENAYEALWAMLSKSGEWEGEIWSRRKNGVIYPEWLSFSAIENPSGKVTHYVGIFSDITERTLTEERLFFLAYHDILTGLPNRRLLIDRLTQEIKQVARSRQKLALIQINLGHSKMTEERARPPETDALLLEIAERLKENVRGSDTISRLENSFMILLTESQEIEHTATIAQKILSNFSKPLLLEGQGHGLNLSIGISLYPADGTTCEALLKHADRAASRVQAEGGNGYEFYSEAIGTASLERIALKMAIEQGLDSGEFQVYYQPKMDLKTGQISCVEALSRWKHPEKGLTLPAAFIPMAEETSQILRLGESVLMTACTQIKKWQQSGLPEMGLSVNFSARQFQQDNLVRIVSETLDQCGLEPSILEMEITESVALADFEKGVGTMKELQALGVKLAIDDFGVGYASLGYIREFPIHTLKIDQSFIRNLAVNKSDAAITTAIIAMAHSLNLDVVAEGVETEEQLRFLKRHGCDRVQGYLTGRPLPADLCEDFLRARIAS